ncbi:peptide cleavage/export ABC transporter [Streptococcus pluranimalium]|uniref:peptide cleavage/export ABC transporter n=1 Tax=Streptococcus hyovaginalis TaxID=149015 RepID=UPI00147841B8|nr:peptide cleavage/export ABC transporter [Streptococcus hyovaginalis]
MFKKYSYVPQIDMRDCGLAALSSIIQHYGSYYSLAYLRQLAQTNMEGTTALGIITPAEKLGFETHAVQADISLFKMDSIPFPFIVHVNKQQKIPHYYVVYGVSKNKIIIGDPDPSVKITKLSLERFSSEWTGTTIFIAPGNNYQIHKEKKHSLIDFIPKFRNYTTLINKIILLSILITTISILGSYYLQEVLDAYIPKQKHSSLNIITLGLVVSYIAQQIFFYLKTYLLEKLNLHLTSELFLDYLKHIFDLPLSFFSTRRTGEIISRFTDATTIIDALASTLLSIFLDATIVFTIGGVMLFQNQLLFLITLGVIPIYALIIFIFIPIFSKMNNEVMHENAKLNSLLIEDINGIESIKSLSAEAIRFQHLDKMFSKYLTKSLKLSRFEAIQQALKQVVQLLLNLLILWIGSKLVISHKLSVGQLITYTTLLVYFITPLENIINLQTKLQAAKVANNRLNEVYLVESEHKPKIGKNLKDIESDFIKIHNLSYQYGFNSPTLKNINLTIYPGKKVCFIGESGSGKTTLAKLIVQFFEPTSGEIFISGENLVNIDKREVRKHVNYLPQQPYIFSGSILDNLTLGSNDISEEKIIRACQIAEILNDILNMPLQFQTELTDGSTLSGGQKQRLALARALLTDSPVMILDESTSSLDVLTEQKVINNLLKLTDKTIIFIAHRLSIAALSDYIFILKNGEIIEEGTHPNLVQKNGYYSQLINVQN